MSAQVGTPSGVGTATAVIAGVNATCQVGDATAIATNPDATAVVSGVEAVASVGSAAGYSDSVLSRDGWDNLRKKQDKYFSTMNAAGRPDGVSVSMEVGTPVQYLVPKVGKKQVQALGPVHATAKVGHVTRLQIGVGRARPSGSGMESTEGVAAEAQVGTVTAKGDWFPTDDELLVIFDEIQRAS